MEGRNVSHYRVLEKIGEGGMGEVYLAADTSLERKVALKFLPVSLENEPVARKRFLKEAKSAAALDHPYVCKVYEAGEAEGRSFIAMEYLEGQTLQERLATGRLPLRDALRIATEIAEAVEGAHKLGIVHRDLKPSNIMLTSDGHTKVMDFGLAKRMPVENVGEEETTQGLTGRGTPLGTLAYMSPEQLRGEEADSRTDIFSLGIVLYEMLSGVHPFHKSSPMETASAILRDIPALLSRYNRNVSEVLEHTVQKMLTKDLDQRSQSIREIRTDLVQLQPGVGAVFTQNLVLLLSGLARPFWLMLVMISLAVVLGGLTWWVYENYFRAPEIVLGFQERDWILIADFENLSGEVEFEHTLDGALTVSIQQSRHVNVVARNLITQTLQRMGREQVEKLDQELAREVALREGIRGVLACAINRVDQSYKLSAQIVDPATGLAVLTLVSEADGKDTVLGALDELAGKVRQNLGESLSSISKQKVPLIQATTPSLRALQVFAESRRLKSVDYNAAHSLLEEAVELDPEFALAHAELGFQCYQSNNPAKGAKHFATALELINRLTVRERLWIRGLAEECKGNREKAITNFRAYTTQYLDDGGGWFRLGYQYLVIDRCDQAIAAFREAIRIVPSDWVSLINIATCFSKLGNYTEAIVHYEEAIELHPEALTEGNLNHELGFLYVEIGQPEKAREIFQIMLSKSDSHQARGHRSLALLEMFLGRYSKAIEHLKESLLIYQSSRSKLSEFRNRLYLAKAYEAKGMIDEFERELVFTSQIKEQIRLGPGWLVLAGKIYARSGRLQEANRLLEELSTRVDDPTALSGISPNADNNRAAQSLLQGEVELAQGKFDSAEEFFALAHRLNDSNYNLESLAFCHFHDGEYEEAIRRYQELISRKQLGWEAQECWILAHYQLGRCYEALGDSENAKASYDRFLEIWAHADEDLLAMVDTRKRLAALNPLSHDTDSSGPSTGSIGFIFRRVRSLAVWAESRPRRVGLCLCIGCFR